MSFAPDAAGVWGGSLPAPGGSFLGSSSFLADWGAAPPPHRPLSASADGTGAGAAALLALGGALSRSPPGAGGVSEEPPSGSGDEAAASGGLDAAPSLELRDLLTLDLLDLLDERDAAAAAAGAAAAAAGRGGGGGGGGRDQAAAPATPAAAAAPSPRAPRKPARRPGAPPGAPDPAATDFLFALATSVHEEVFPGAAGERGAGARRQVAADAVEALEQLGAEPAGCDAEAEDGAPLTLLTLLFRNNDWGGARSRCSPRPSRPAPTPTRTARSRSPRRR